MSDTLTIITNHHERPVLTWWDLSPAEQAELDYYVTENTDSRNDFQGFRYRGQVYDLGDFMPTEISGWDGFAADSYFSGVAVRFPDDSYNEYVIVARCFA